ncbi:MAG: hypothetical protein KGO53_11585 [Alphaproteobacteria bacterium]|nr:hypothetical protein [Alphaproteobacteria bacterium]
MRVHAVLSAQAYQSFRVPLDEVMQLGPAQDAALEELQNPGWALHEFDFAKGEAVFLDVGAQCNLFEAGFAYQKMMRSARRAAFLPFDQFLAFAAAMPAPSRLIHLFNMGHCGSTLLHQVFNASGAVWSLSEPKFAADLGINRAGLSGARRKAMAQAGLAWLARLPFAGERPAMVLKHFSHGIKLMLEWAAASPSGTVNLFMYRDAASWCNSRFGFAQRRGFPTVMTPEIRRARWFGMSAGMPESVLEGIVDMEAAELRFDDLAAMCWALFVQDYQSAVQAGLNLLPFSYADLRDNREATLRRIFAACGLPEDSVGPALQAFNKDSHEGESTAHDKPVAKLPPDSSGRIASILSHPRLKLDGNARL